MLPDQRAHILSTLNPKVLELILYPTEQCNFRCTYCYEDFELGKMSEEVQESIKKLLNKRIGGLSHLQLSWFGGEPLAAKSVVLNMSSYAHNLCMRNNVTLHGALTTNGYLLDIDTATSLCELEQRKFQISLDGHESGHDVTRKLANGDGTFWRIWGNLETLRDSALDFEITLRLHLTPENLDSMLILARRLRDEFLHDKRFKVFIKAIENLGGPNNGRISSITREARAEAINGIRTALGIGQNPSAGPLMPYVCYAGRPNSFAIRADGGIQKCTVALNDSMNNVGRIDGEGHLNLDQDKLQNWMYAYGTEKPEHLQCPVGALPRQTKKTIPITPV